MGDLGLSPADCCCCPPGCFADDTDPTTRQFAVTLTGIVDNDCVYCGAYNATYTPLEFSGACRWGWELGDQPTCLRDPAVFLSLPCADSKITITVDLYDDTGLYFTWSKEVDANLVTPAYLDGLSLPLTSPDNNGACLATDSTCTIHTL